MVVTQDLISRYKEKMRQELNLEEVTPYTLVSKEYLDFKKDAIPGKINAYEKLCKFAGSILKIKIPEDKRKELERNLEISHLEITPESTVAAAYIIPLVVLLLGVVVSLVILNSVFFAFFTVVISVTLIVIFGKLPEFFASAWRMKASNQMVLAVFYIVTYMRHTSNLERAIDFASEHLTPPLSLDLKKVLWDVETEKYENIQQALEAYLETWRRYNKEFIESIHLVESSLLESLEERRLAMLDKSLEVMLDETYEKMLHYAQNLKGPITILHMMGVILPILGLVLLPLLVSMMSGVAWYHIATLYNITLPLIVYVLSRNILSKRPTGYGDADVAEINPELKKYEKFHIHIGTLDIAINPLWIALTTGIISLIIALSPVIIHTINPSFDLDLPFRFKLIDYHPSVNNPSIIVGPYGIGATLLSLFFPLGLAFSVGLYYKLKSTDVIKIRENTKKLEDEFSGALFQLANRLGDGLPAEIAFERVSNVMQDTLSGQFFQIVTANIRKLGMGVHDAIFNQKTGALLFFPSNIVHSSMKVLIESIRKGPRIAATALLNVARYIKEIHKVNERLKDLLADIISDMKSQISFLTPAIAGIVIGITAMITYILGGLTTTIKGASVGGSPGQFSSILGMFGDGVPTYYFQMVVGIYVFQIIYVLTIMSNGVENGADKLGERYALGKNLVTSTLTYCGIAFVVMLTFNLIASLILARAVT